MIKFLRAIRRRLQKEFKNYKLRRSLKKLLRQKSSELIDPKIIDSIICNWDNQGWSAKTSYILQMCKFARENKGSILECGSGLTTLILGIITKDYSPKIISLEHQVEWVERINHFLKDFGIKHVEILHSPLVSYGEYSWYKTATEKLPQSFSLVVCDGPPGSTLGGRYGLSPQMKERMKQGTIVLLDDILREEEQKILSRWLEEFGDPQSCIITEQFASFVVK